MIDLTARRQINGKTLLHYACRQGHRKVIAVLLSLIPALADVVSSVVSGCVVKSSFVNDDSLCKTRMALT
jgi:ankyrin repeat protein